MTIDKRRLCTIVHTNINTYIHVDILLQCTRTRRRPPSMFSKRGNVVGLGERGACLLHKHQFEIRSDTSSIVLDVSRIELIVTLIHILQFKPSLVIPSACWLCQLGRYHICRFFNCPFPPTQHDEKDLTFVIQAIQHILTQR